MDLLNKISEVVIPGLLFVFIALIILIFSVELVGKILRSIEGRRSGGGSSPAESQPKPKTAQAPPPAQKQIAASGIAGETVAAIAAAVSCVMEQSAPGVPYAITSVSRAAQGHLTGGRPVWGFAGMQQNTRPF